jgi:hypothetical protein
MMASIRERNSSARQTTCACHESQLVLRVEDDQLQLLTVLVEELNNVIRNEAPIVHGRPVQFNNSAASLDNEAVLGKVRHRPQMVLTMLKVYGS